MPNTPPDPAGLSAAREYARYELGSSAWADSILAAYFDPESVWERREKQDLEHEARMAEIRQRNAANA